MSLSRRDQITTVATTASALVASTNVVARSDDESAGPSLDALAKAKGRIGFGSFLNSYAREPGPSRGIPADFDDIKAREVHLRSAAL